MNRIPLNELPVLTLMIMDVVYCYDTAKGEGRGVFHYPELRARFPGFPKSHFFSLSLFPEIFGFAHGFL